MNWEPDPFRNAVEAVMRSIGEAEVERARLASDRPRGCVLMPDGDRLQLIVPHGYEASVQPLIQQFGERLVVEFDDGWFGYAPLTDGARPPRPETP